MDEALKALVAATGDGQPVIDFSNPDTGELTLRASADAIETTTHTLKPLAELYGKGTGKESVDLRDEDFLALLMAIEEAILDFEKIQPSLTDGAVLGSLDRLCMTPEANVANDPLAVWIQLGLRLTLSLNDFSRQDAKHALRKVKQSVNRHNKLAGTRGYLNFIRQQLRRT